MKPIEGWNDAPAYTGEFETLPAGKYVCQIVQVNVTQDQKGREQMVILFDIADGEHKGYYDRMFQGAKRNDASQAKWKGIFRQLTQGNSLPFFKGVITSIEKSNPGYKWNWEEKSLVRKKFGGIFGREEFIAKGNSLPFFKGVITSIEKSNPGYKWNWEEKSLVRKKFGGIFGREEFIANDGKKRMATKCVQIRSVDGLKDAEVPEDKLLPENAASQQAHNYPYINNGTSDGFMNIPNGVEDEGLPFN